VRARPDRSLRRACVAVASTLAVGAAVLAPVAPAVSAPGDPPVTNAVTAWNEHAADASLSCLLVFGNPLHEVRLYAMMHIAIHDALNAIDRRSEPYAYDAHAPGAAPDAAVAAAAHDVLTSELAKVPDLVQPTCIPASLDIAEDAYTEELAAIPDGTAKDAGIAVGQAAAAAIIALRADDGSDTAPLIPFDTADQPGEYRNDVYFMYGWKDLDLFALRDSSQFQPGPPFPLKSRMYARDLDEIKRLGGDGVTTPSDRTPEQTEIAMYWVESSPLMWNRMGRELAASQGLDLWESARLFGLLNIAMSDGYVASWEAKAHYQFWRPVTAIHLADEDGNRFTSADPTWTPLVPTPPVADYPSAHATEGGAASAVFREFFGTDDLAFSTCSYTLPERTCAGDDPILRHFTSFSQAAAENSESRILVGFHFRDATEAGQRQGERIGVRVVNRVLEPVH
jgi:hypothetical protein